MRWRLAVDGNATQLQLFADMITNVISRFRAFRIKACTTEIDIRWTFLHPLALLLLFI